MIFLLPEQRDLLFVIGGLIKLLKVDEENVEITLFNWNNNSGVEYDLLQSVFPSKIPQYFNKNVLTNPPVAGFLAKPDVLVHFLIIAIIVDASFKVEWLDQNKSLRHFDLRMQVVCNPDLKEEIRRFLNEFNLDELSNDEGSANAI